MRLRHIPMMLLLVAALAALAAAGDDLINLKNKQWISVPETPSITIAPGGNAKLQVKFHVGDGMHINSNRPKSELLIPTTLSVKSAETITVGKVAYPNGAEISLPFDPTEKLSVYSGDVAFSIPVTVTRNAKPGSYTLHAEIHYQACNDHSCFPPRTLPVELTVVVK